jgi:septin family protein
MEQNKEQEKQKLIQKAYKWIHAVVKVELQLQSSLLNLDTSLLLTRLQTFLTK